MNKTMKRMNDFGERKYIFCRGEQNVEGKGGKHVEKENISFSVEKKNREGKVFLLSHLPFTQTFTG